jgi:AcrR family transcriptional regulator
MTRHKSREEWIEAILEAARAEIDESGYGGFSMEGIVRRTGFSKGGIYRFFKNKSDVALEIFASSYRGILDIEIEQCVLWNLPMDETIFKLINRYSDSEEGARMTDRIWMRLLPEVLNDKRFTETRSKLLAGIEEKMILLSETLAERDGLQMRDDMYERVPDAISMGVGLMEGFAIQSALGGSIEYQGMLAKQFVSGVVKKFYKYQQE